MADNLKDIFFEQNACIFFKIPLIFHVGLIKSIPRCVR